MMDVMEGCQTYEEIVMDCGEPERVWNYVMRLGHGFVAQWGRQCIWFENDGCIIDEIIPEHVGL